MAQIQNRSTDTLPVGSTHISSVAFAKKNHSVIYAIGFDLDEVVTFPPSSTL